MLILLFFNVVTAAAYYEDFGDLALHAGKISNEQNGPQLSSTNGLGNGKEYVAIQLFYETLCPHCIEFMTKNFNDTITKLESQLFIYLYPYGNSKRVNDTDPDKIAFVCQHGPAECYGNKLHACAWYYHVDEGYAYLHYDLCMMKKGSDDAAADACAKRNGFDSETITKCAKSVKGDRILEYIFMDSTEYFNVTEVPFVIINGKVPEKMEDVLSNFMKYVCDEFYDKPKACLDAYL